MCWAPREASGLCRALGYALRSLFRGLSMSDEYRDWQDEAVRVVRNHEAVCSLWPADRTNPLGWEDAGFSGAKQECLEHIKANCDGNCRWVGPQPESNTMHSRPKELSS
jgi:MbtH protein